MSTPALSSSTPSRLRDFRPLAADLLWFALAVALGLVMSSWLSAALGLRVPLPVEHLLIL